MMQDLGLVSPADQMRRSLDSDNHTSIALIIQAGVEGKHVTTGTSKGTSKP
jgi:hypothetical protein